MHSTKGNWDQRAGLCLEHNFASASKKPESFPNLSSLRGFIQSAERGVRGCLCFIFEPVRQTKHYNNCSTQNQQLWILQQQLLKDKTQLLSNNNVFILLNAYYVLPSVWIIEFVVKWWVFKPWISVIELHHQGAVFPLQLVPSQWIWSSGLTGRKMSNHQLWLDSQILQIDWMERM